ncbi:hypothetical protein A0J61_07590 [Choanephora cucurbitarum]|uniref:Uncharacterized protein n=1 Tax=Choanephora cucurbitarum TaxID=101091 RepID=A0A1C7NAG9_9FUNG|nr:hypothetical protein A0J61_07590 [Choanephora cucurbitarum]
MPYASSSITDSRTLVSPQPVTYRSNGSITFDILTAPNINASVNTITPSIVVGKDKRRKRRGFGEHNCLGKVNRKRYISPRCPDCGDEVNCPGL